MVGYREHFYNEPIPTNSSGIELEDLEKRANNLKGEASAALMEALGLAREKQRNAEETVRNLEQKLMGSDYESTMQDLGSEEPRALETEPIAVQEAPEKQVDPVEPEAPVVPVEPEVQEAPVDPGTGELEEIEEFGNMNMSKFPVDLILKSIFFGAIFYLLSLPEVYKMTKKCCKQVDGVLLHSLVFAILYFILSQFIN